MKLVLSVFKFILIVINYEILGQITMNDSGITFGVATIEWEIPKEAKPGIYRLRHFGSTKETKESPNKYFTGTSSSFTVIA